MERKNEVSLYLNNISLILLGILFLTFPLVFTNITTDPFTLPKQILLSLVTVITLIFFGAKMISERKVRIRRTPFDFPVFLFTIIVFLSSLFAINRFDSLISFVPLLFAVSAFFVITNFVRKESSIVFLLSALIIGASVLSLLTILSFFKVYILPLSFTHVQTFTPFGSLLDQALYLGVILFATLYFALRLLKVKNIKEIHKEEFVFAASFIVILAGFALTVYQLLRLNPLNGGLLLLPIGVGFQTALASISQDAGRLTQGLLFGSGFGTYVTDFTRFKLPTFNLNTTLWSLTFFKSSSFILELLATTGILGFLSYLYLAFKIANIKIWKEKVKSNPIFLALVVLLIASFLLPLSFVGHTTLFLLLGLFAAIEGVGSNPSKEHEYYDVDLHFVASKNSMLSLSTSLVDGETKATPKHEELPLTKFLPVSFFIFFTLFAAIIGFYAVRYVASDIVFQNSLVAASNNNGLQTYNNQVSAIGFFPYRDVYYRVYSQTNLALATALGTQQSEGASLSAQTQQTIYTLIQQSINSARQAVALSPQSVLNWQNLSSIYRSLIGFGQNAESFALVSQQQAVLLDPNNPQEYINLGGIYYQLQQYDNAQRQFQVAINLKPDYANGYYNLGHALENKGDLQNALAQYQAVKTLVAGNTDAEKKISVEIETLQQKIGKATEASTTPSTSTKVKETKVQKEQPQLKISTPSAQLPEQKPQVKIPAPINASDSGR